MKQVYLKCYCKKACKLSLKLKNCTVTDQCELYQNIVAKKCISKAQETKERHELNLEEYLISQQRPNKLVRGIPGFIKEELLKIIRLDPDIGPKVDWSRKMYKCTKKGIYPNY